MTIVYSTNAGSTERYAKMLSEKLSCPMVKTAKAGDIDENEEIIFMSWIMTGTLQDYAAVKEQFVNIKAVCAVGMFSGEKKIDEVGEKNQITEKLFFLPGAFDINKLTGMYKMMINMVMKMMKGKLKGNDEPNAKDMIEKLEEGFDFVNEENLQKVIEFIG